MFGVVPSLECCVGRAMEGRWSTFRLQFVCLVVLFLGSGLRGTSSLNLEGSILMKFRDRILSDPYNALANWDCNDLHPCNWFGVHCVDGKVQMLDLSGLSLEGTLALELGNLSNLRALVLHTNHLSGTIPTEFASLTLLEVLDLRGNNFTGMFPVEIAKLGSVKRLLLCNNNFEGSVPPEIEELSLPFELQYHDYIGSVNNRKIGLWPNAAEDSGICPQARPNGNLESLYGPRLLQKGQDLAANARRQLAEQSSNLEVVLINADTPEDQFISLPISRSSGSFPSTGPDKGPYNASPLTAADITPQQMNPPVQTTPDTSEKGRPLQKVWLFVAVALGVAFLLALAIALYFMCRRRDAKPVAPVAKTGISGLLQKAFITGTPKLNRAELDTACEDFSNIIATFETFTIYKGTLSSGLEIAVISTRITSSKEWCPEAELAYRKKIQLLSRVNHKNFVNLIGYCEEREPFTRMMVFEYTPSGLFDHIHVKEVEHLEWDARVRAIMGISYCLQYMHHDLHPPIVHSNLTSRLILLTDDFAAKIAEWPFDILPKSKDSVERRADQRENVYEFGILLLEIITGRLPYSEEEGLLIDWATQYLKDKENYKELIDPILTSVKSNELDVICDVIQRCTLPDPMQRPTIQALTSRLREAILLTPEAAAPRLSPLWWAELEILEQ